MTDPRPGTGSRAVSALLFYRHTLDCSRDDAVIVETLEAVSTTPWRRRTRRGE